MEFAAKLALVLFYTLFCLSWVPRIYAATEYNRYLAHIFQKYGDGSTMSFEGFEHLMYSLGLGQIEFDENHTIDEHRPEGLRTEITDEDLIRLKIDNHIMQQTEKLFYNEESSNDHLDEREEGKALPAKKVYLNDANLRGAGDLSDISLKGADSGGVILEFKELHDPKHRHPRRNDEFSFLNPIPSTNTCLSPKSLLHLVVDHKDLHERKLYQRLFTEPLTDNHNVEDEYNKFVNNVRITPVTFMKLCPALLAQIDQHVCIKPAPMIISEDLKEQIWNAWIYATCSISILSACGLLGIFLVPLMESEAYNEILKFLIAIAAGTLSGDALMHLLPHAIQGDHHDSSHQESSSESKHGHNNTTIYLFGCAFIVTLVMFMLEHLLPILKGESGSSHGHSHGPKTKQNHSHSHGHNHSHNHNHNNETVNHNHSHKHNQGDATVANDLPQPDLKDIKEINIMLNETKPDMKSPAPPLTPVAFMVIIGDGLHNLTDGLAIGAAFATDPVTGLATAVAVLCHELPHELGDFALLLQTGLPLRRVLCLNIVSSILSFLGMVIGLLIAGMNEHISQWIYAGTAGSFLYIAFADLIPAMATENQSSLKGVLIQVLGIALGGLIMLIIAMYEEGLEELFS